jgi:nitrite reductase/ring-hydroxylating ferredoxin subunit
MTDWRDLPFAPQPGTSLCRIDEVPDGGGKEIAFGAGREAFRVLLLRRGEHVWAYLNICPHFSIPLNYEPDKFLTFDGEILMCAHHTAFFHFDDGHCFDGPCAGSNLHALPVSREGASIRFGEAVS